MNHQTGRIGMRPSRALFSTALAVVAVLFWSARLPAAGVPKDEAAIRHALSRLTSAHVRTMWKRFVGWDSRRGSIGN
jgi:hypothetical protein